MNAEKRPEWRLVPDPSSRLQIRVHPSGRRRTANAAMVPYLRLDSVSVAPPVPKLLCLAMRHDARQQRLLRHTPRSGQVRLVCSKHVSPSDGLSGLPSASRTKGHTHKLEQGAGKKGSDGEEREHYRDARLISHGLVAGRAFRASCLARWVECASLVWIGSLPVDLQQWYRLACRRAA